MNNSTLFDFTVFPRLETPRLILRELVVQDAEAVFRVRGDYEVTKYNIGNAYQRPEQAVDLIAAIAQAYQEKAELRWGHHAEK